MTQVAGWLWFAVVQIICGIAALIGLVLLIPFCVARAWRPVSSGSGRAVDAWSWGPLNLIWGNPEDGVSGAHALIWTATGQVPYLPNAHPAWRAWSWSAVRNTSDGLKYRFQWKGGPFRRWAWRSWYVQAGWNSAGLPVLSAGRH